MWHLLKSAGCVLACPWEVESAPHPVKCKGLPRVQASLGCYSRDGRSIRPVAPHRDTEDPFTHWHGWPGWPCNQLAKADMQNWKILNITACDLGAPSVPTGGKSNRIPCRHDGESGHLDAILKQCLMKWENALAALCFVAHRRTPRSAQWTHSVI